MSHTRLPAALSACLACLSLGVSAAEDSYSTGINTDYPKQVFFGDLHLHSNISADAHSMGNLLLTSADAYRFARGEKVVASNGLPATKAPTRFLVRDRPRRIHGPVSHVYHRGSQINRDRAWEKLGITVFNRPTPMKPTQRGSHRAIPLRLSSTA